MTQFLFCVLVASGLYFCNAYRVSYPKYSDCCGQFKLTPYTYPLCYWNLCYTFYGHYYIYYLTSYEKMGWCKWTYHPDYNRKYSILPNRRLFGNCICIAEATGCFIAPTTAAPSVSPGPETAEPTASPGPETEEPTSSPRPETEEPTASPGPETEEPTASPGPETEEPTASPGPETEEPTASPEPETEEPTASPGPGTEEPTASPGPETEEPTASPGPETEQPATSPEPTASPGPGTEEPTPVTEPEPAAETTFEVPTTTAQPATTTPSVCPTPPAKFSGRVHGGTSECTQSAVLSFWVDSKQTCNGVLGYVPSSKGKVVILTEFCAIYLEAYTMKEAHAFGLYNGAYFPVTPQTNFTTLPNHLAIMAPPGTLSQAQCTSAPACPYDPATMSDLIDFGSCYISSYGAGLFAGQPVSTGSLNRADVTKQASCTSRPATQDKTHEPECFVAVDPNVKNCWGDNGAPVFCHLIGSGEEVLYGLVDLIHEENSENAKNKCATSEFHVIPIN